MGVLAGSLGWHLTRNIPCPSRVSTSSFPQIQTVYEVGEAFTLHLNVENVSDLGGWQADIIFDPDVLRADQVSEGNFLKDDDEQPFFDAGTINNKTGRITGLKAVRISQDRIGRQGRLLSVEFTIIGSGESGLTVNNFQVGSRRGETIPIITPELSLLWRETGPLNPLGM